MTFNSLNQIHLTFSTLVYLEMSGPKVRTVAEVSKRIFGHVIRAPNTR